MNKIFIAIQLIAFFALAHTRPDDEWHYPTPGSNGIISELEAWGGQCDNGRRQSPIDLTQAAAVRGEFAPFIFNNYKLPIKQAQLLNTGHSVQVNNADAAVSVQGGGLPGRFVLDQMHFHWGSEHTVAGTRYGLELHLVHHDARYPTLGDAVSARNGVAVLGVLFHVSSQPNMHIGTILDTATEIRQQAGKSAPLKGKLSPYNLLPANRTSYFRYEGSLTTPACAESVLWTVFTESIGVSLEQVEQFKVIQDQSGQELLINFRSLQPLNARALVYATEWDQVGRGQSTMRQPCLLALLTSLALITFARLH